MSSGNSKQGTGVVDEAQQPGLPPAANETAETAADSRGPEALIVVPEDWWVIPLPDADHRKRSIKKFVELHLGRADMDAQMRAELRDTLLDAATAAAEQGGRLIAFPVPAHGDEYPFVAQLTVFRENLELDTVRIRLQMERADASIAPSEYGPIMREVHQQAGPELWGAEQVEQLFANYWLDPKDGYGLYHAAFSSPHLELKDQLLELFDEIATSVMVYRPELSPEDMAVIETELTSIANESDQLAEFTE